MKANGKASPWYGKVMTASLPSEVKKIWFSRDEELPELPQHRWSWELQDDMEQIEQRELAVKILESVALDKRHVFVLHRRIIDEATLQEVSEELGVTRERVRQMELKVLRHLRKVQNRFTGINPWDLSRAEVTTWRGWRWCS
jgi:RNA polymerase sigma factor (sigma-70 family)